MRMGARKRNPPLGAMGKANLRRRGAKSSFLRRTSSLLLGMVLFLPFPVLGAPADLQLVLEAEKTTLVVGEPLEIRLRVTNRGNEPVAGDFFPSFELDRVRLSIAKDGGETLPLVSKTLAIARTKKTLSDPVTLPPGGAVEATETIGFDVNRGAPAFGEPGRYQLRATLFYENYARELSSNPLAVEVEEPRGIDAQAWQFVQVTGLAAFLGPEARLFPVTEAIVSRLRELATRFEGSRYAPFAEVGLESICRQAGQSQVPPGCPAPVACGGDCDGSGAISAAELAAGARAIFDRAACRAADRNEDGVVRANEIVAATWNLRVGCSGAPSGARRAQTK